MLATFKYAAFAVENVAALCAAAGVDFRAARPDLPLPIGVSFFTFQAISYLVDVRRGKTAPAASLLDFATYAAFFPHLVAGPIVRADGFLPQLRDEPRPDAAALERGATLVVVGLFQKLVLADALFAPVADAVFARGARPDAVAAWTGTFAFTGQIYCDFAGYTTAAIGVAAMLGLHLNENFRRPYGAATFSDFWRRWHVSLSSWLRDYLYFPLGGGRLGRARTYVNLMVVMLIGGLWHGASWTFVVWGGLNGLFLAVERAGDWRDEPRAAAARIARWVFTLTLVATARVFFRAPDFDGARTVLASMFGGAPDRGALALDAANVVAPLVGLAAIAALHRRYPDAPPDAFLSSLPRPARAVALAAVFVAIAVMARPDRAFIYFQF